MRRRSGLLEQGLNWGRLLLVVCLTALAVGTAGAAAEAATSAAIVVDAKSGKVLY